MLDQNRATLATALKMIPKYYLTMSSSSAIYSTTSKSHGGLVNFVLP